MLMMLLMWVGATLASAAGGALTGMKLAGEHMGHQMAALMGAFFGMSTVVPAALVALVAHRLA